MAIAPFPPQHRWDRPKRNFNTKLGTLCSFCFFTFCLQDFSRLWFLTAQSDKFQSRPLVRAQHPCRVDTISSGLCIWPHGQWAACTCSSMTFLRSFTLAFILKVNGMLFPLLQMPGWLNDTLRRHAQHCTFTAYLTGAIFPTKAFTCHLLSHDTTCQVLIWNVSDHPVSPFSFRDGKLNKTLSRFHTKGIMCISNVVN